MPGHFADQSRFDIRCEWGSSGLRAVGDADVIIIVDVLSFSTCVDVAVARGAIVYPYAWQTDDAAAFAAERSAELAGPRGRGRWSLSPASMRQAVAGSRIVLPSPNGSQLTAEAVGLGRVVLTACLRNAGAVAARAASMGRTFAVIPCGERWPDGSARHCVEDLAGAGAVIDALPGSRSSEAAAAAPVWQMARADAHGFLASCASGRELIERGFAGDVQIAGEAGASAAAPVMREGAYINWSSGAGGGAPADRAP